MQDEFEGLKASHEGLKKRSATATPDVVKKNTELQHRNAELEKENTALSQENSSLSQENTTLSQKNTSLSREISNLRATWSALSASKYSLGLDHSTLHTHRQNLDLRKNLNYIQAISAHNAQQATLSSNALRNAESKIAALQEENAASSKPLQHKPQT